MVLTFPADFEFGTSTSAYQIETPFRHDWVDVQARDGHRFTRTTDHELNLATDAALIASVAPYYRMSMMWSKLQQKPFDEFNRETVDHYLSLLNLLQKQNVKVMLVLHHFANPTWFAQLGGWQKKENISMWLDFVRRSVNAFGQYISSWNTFNEPNLYTSMGWIAGEFPPFRKNLLAAKKVLNNIARAHDQAYDLIKAKFPRAPVGLSHNCTVFSANNFLGVLPARFTDYWYMEYASSLFKKMDFFGMSYYARIGHDPLPVTYLTTPKKFDTSGKPHDDMWEYYPEGILECITRFWKKFKKPIVITENGICTKDDTKRIKAIKDYLSFIHHAIETGIDVKGYYHWSTWDNFEWSLGPSYQFGLYGCDPATKERLKKPSADVYSRIAHSRQVVIP